MKGLDLSVTQDAIRDLFAEYGAVKEARLVTYRNGRSKGLAFIDFEDEASAQKALMKTDGLRVGSKEISVAFSNPPERKQPQAKQDAGDAAKQQQQQGRPRFQNERQIGLGSSVRELPNIISRHISVFFLPLSELAP